MHWAARGDHAAVCAWLFAHGAADDVRGAAQLRQTPLALAAAQNAHGARRAARLSLARGCRGDMTLKLPS